MSAQSGGDAEARGDSRTSGTSKPAPKSLGFERDSIRRWRTRVASLYNSNGSTTSEVILFAELELTADPTTMASLRLGGEFDDNRDAEVWNGCHWRRSGLGCPLLFVLRDQAGSPRRIDLILQVGFGKRRVLSVDCGRARVDGRSQRCAERRGA